MADSTARLSPSYIGRSVKREIAIDDRSRLHVPGSGSGETGDHRGSRESQGICANAIEHDDDYVLRSS
jgi:hypothetical protein